MTIITINGKTQVKFNNFDQVVAFINRNDVKHDTWGKEFVVHSVPTLGDLIGYEDLVHEVEFINRVFGINIRMAY